MESRFLTAHEWLSPPNEDPSYVAQRPLCVIETENDDASLCSRMISEAESSVAVFSFPLAR